MNQYGFGKLNNLRRTAIVTNSASGSPVKSSDSQVLYVKCELKEWIPSNDLSKMSFINCS